MVLNQSVKRLISKRNIGIDLYELSDGRVGVRGTFLDPYHLISLMFTIDPETRVISEASSEFTNFPHSVCPFVEQKAAELNGLVIGRGIIKEIQRRIGGGSGCVHLRELASECVNFGATALIGFKQGYGIMSPEFNNMDEDERFNISKDVLKGTCHVFE